MWYYILFKCFPRFLVHQIQHYHKHNLRIFQIHHRYTNRNMTFDHTTSFSFGLLRVLKSRNTHKSSSGWCPILSYHMRGNVLGGVVCTATSPDMPLLLRGCRYIYICCARFDCSYFSPCFSLFVSLWNSNAHHNMIYTSITAKISTAVMPWLRSRSPTIRRYEVPVHRVFCPNAPYYPPNATLT